MPTVRKKLLLFPPMQTYPGTLVQVVQGGITSNSFATGAITAAAFSQAAADKVWATAARSLTDKAGFTLTAGSYSVRASSTQQVTMNMINTDTGTAVISSVTTTRAVAALQGLFSSEAAGNLQNAFTKIQINSATEVGGNNYNNTTKTNVVNISVVEFF